MDYQGLNDIIKKNQYLLPLIKKTLSGILKVRYFIKSVSPKDKSG